MDIAQPYIQIIQQVGFPIFVCVWLLSRTDKKIEKMTEVLQKVASNLELISHD